MKFKLLTCTLAGALICTPNLYALSIDEAYEAIPHRQTTFNLNASNATSKDKIFLSKIFSITDEAMAARVEHLTSLYYYKGHGETGNSLYNRKVDPLIQQLKALNPPAPLRKYYQLVLESIQEQKQFFKEWAEAPKSKKKHLKKTYSKHPLVQSSHRKLIAAYRELVGLFPQENKHNKQAFFDHLCALDFL